MIIKIFITLGGEIYHKQSEKNQLHSKTFTVTSNYLAKKTLIEKNLESESFCFFCV